MSNADPSYWPGDHIDLAVWAAVGGHYDLGLAVGETPEDVSNRLRSKLYSWDAACAELGLHPAMRRDVAITAAWAGIARTALQRRDKAIRSCLIHSCPTRVIGEATGMSHTAITRVRDRAQSPGSRW